MNFKDEFLNSVGNHLFVFELDIGQLESEFREFLFSEKNKNGKNEPENRRNQMINLNLLIQNTFMNGLLEVDVLWRFTNK